MNSSLVFVLLLVGIVMFAGVIRTYLIQRNKEPENNKELEETLAKIDLLEERIRVLERIITENRFDLKQEIDFRAISFESKQLAEKARTRGLSIEEMSGSTFTLSNLGMFGVEHFTAIINPPNSAILAVGGAIEKPVVRDHQLTVGHEMSATLSSDHRIIDGAMAAAYLQTLRGYLEMPGVLVV